MTLTTTERRHEAGGVRGAVVSGLAWKGASQVSIQVMRFGIAVTLARLLSPQQYGVAGMLLVFMTFVLLFSDVALGPTLVQRQNLTDDECSTAFWTSIAAGLTFAGAAVALAGPVSAFFHEPDLRPMVMVLASTFLIQSVGATQSSLLVRDMAFRSLESRHMAATAVSGAVAIAVAALGYGAWAIVAQQLANALVSTVLVWRFSRWRPRRHFSVSTLRSFAGFTGNVFGTILLAQLRATTDNLLVGRFLGAAALGAYSIAYNLVLAPFNRIANPLSQVLFPALSRVQDDPGRIGSYWLRSLRLIGAVAVPSCVGLVVVGPDFVRVVLGQKWHHAIPVVQLLAVVGMLQTLQFLSPVILQAVDRTSRLLRWSLLSYGSSLLAFAVGLHWGIAGLALAYVIASVCVEPLFARATARSIGLTLGDLARALAGVTRASAAMAVLLVAGRYWMIRAGLDASERFAPEIALGCLLFLVALRLAARDVVDDVRSLRRQRATAAPASTAG